MTTPLRLPPIAHDFLRGLGRIGYKAISAGIATALKEADVFVEEVDKRLKKGQRAAERMARGEPYNQEDDT